MPMFSGILSIDGARTQAFLDNRLLVIDDPDCGGDLACSASRAYGYFVSKGTLSGSPVTVSGFTTVRGGVSVIQMARGPAACYCEDGHASDGPGPCPVCGKPVVCV